MHDMVRARPDIAHTMGLVSRYLSNLKKEHCEAMTWIFRYLRSTSKSYLCLGGPKPTLEGFTNANMVGDLDHRLLTSVYLFTFPRGAISW